MTVKIMTHQHSPEVNMDVTNDILLIDEALGVGDLEFRQKSTKVMQEKIKSDQTVVLVSHNAQTIRQLCNRAVWIENGVSRLEGDVDRVVDADLGTAALAWCRELAAQDAPRRKTSELVADGIAAGVLDEYRGGIAKRARGQVAPQKIVDCVQASLTRPFVEGLQIERENFIQCMQSPQSAALRHMFFAEREAAKVRGLPKGTPLREVNKVAVIGAGTMGSGIAMNFANAGMQVVLLEVSEEAVGKGLEIIDRNYRGGVERGKMSEDQALACRGRIAGTTDYESLSDVDLVVEAVFENLELKQQVFAKLDGVCRQGAILIGQERLFGDAHTVQYALEQALFGM